MEPQSGIPHNGKTPHYQNLPPNGQIGVYTSVRAQVFFVNLHGLNVASNDFSGRHTDRLAYKIFAKISSNMGD